MKTKKRIVRLTTDVELDLAKRGMRSVHVDIDNKKIAYLTGVVASQDAEADAVAVVLGHDVAQVQDGLVRPGLVAPHRHETGHLGPRSFDKEPHSDMEAALDNPDLKGHRFDGSTAVVTE